MFSMLGKVLVLLIVTISIGCLMGGVAVYTQKMDYVTPRGGEAGKKTLNRVDQARDKAKNLLAANQRAITRLSIEMEPLVDLEGDIIQRRDYYNASLEMMKTGQWYGKQVAEPIQAISYGVETELAADLKDTDTTMKVLSSAGFPPTPFEVQVKDETIQVTQVTRNIWTVVRGPAPKEYGAGDKVIATAQIVRIHTDKEKAPTNPAIKVFSTGAGQPAELAAQPASTYIAERKTIENNIDTSTGKIREYMTKHREHTVAINGNEMIKGLRTRIAEQIKIKEDAEAETAFLEDYVSRRQAEAELFVKRRDLMADRLFELKKFFNIPIEEPKPNKVN